MLSTSRRLMATGAALLPQDVPSGARRVVLETALRLFAERGFSGTSIRDIASACGLQGPTLYSHFPSKEHVLAELLRIAHEEHQRGIRTGLLDSQPDPREQIRAFMRAHVRFHTDFPMLAVVGNSELHMLSPALGAPILQLRRNSEQILIDVVQRGIERGLFKVPHAWLSVAAIGGMGLRVAFWYAPATGIPAEQVADAYAQFALRVLGAA
ncbi:MAG TPA: TetR/AcrR family transcriptional regulator [Candidatus Binatia bacterium]|nr:TetR/AcrR family transcriptional regulator [Candidatus Binatia bacterium]